MVLQIFFNWFQGHFLLAAVDALFLGHLFVVIIITTAPKLKDNKGGILKTVTTILKHARIHLSFSK